MPKIFMEYLNRKQNLLLRYRHYRSEEFAGFCRAEQNRDPSDLRGSCVAGRYGSWMWES